MKAIKGLLLRSMDAPCPHNEIKQLTEFTHKQKITVAKSTTMDLGTQGVWVDVDWNKFAFTMLVNDEYKDLDRSQPLLSVLVILREFELLDEATDYLHWLNLQGYHDPQLQLLEYYKNIVSTHQFLLDRLQTTHFDSFVSDLDFQLNSGPAQYLRSMT